MLVGTIQFLPNVYLIVLILHQCNENEIWSLDAEKIGQISLKVIEDWTKMSYYLVSKRIVFTWIDSFYLNLLTYSIPFTYILWTNLICKYIL